MLIHLDTVLTFQLPASESHSQLTNPLLRTDCLSAPDWPFRGLTPNWLTLNILLFQSRKYFYGHRSLCGFRTKVDKERSSGHSSAASKMPEIRSPPWQPIHKHTETHTPTSIYIYIYIYIHESSLSYHNFLNFYFHFFVFTCFIIFFDWYLVICWHCHIN